MEPRMLVIARQACSVTSAQAPEDHPHSAHSTLLSIRIQKPTLRRCAERERSEEHTSELQSPCNLVCRLLLEKKKKSMKQHRACSKENSHRYVPYASSLT